MGQLAIVIAKHPAEAFRTLLEWLTANGCIVRVNTSSPFYSITHPWSASLVCEMFNDNW